MKKVIHQSKYNKFAKRKRFRRESALNSFVLRATSDQQYIQKLQNKQNIHEIIQEGFQSAATNQSNLIIEEDQNLIPKRRKSVKNKGNPSPHLKKL